MTAVLGSNSFSATDSGASPIQIPFNFGWPVRSRRDHTLEFFFYFRDYIIVASQAAAVRFRERTRSWPARLIQIFR